MTDPRGAPPAPGLTLTGELPLPGGGTATVTVQISVTVPVPPPPPPPPPPPAPPLMTSPHLAISFHPWEPYWAAGATPTPMLAAHLDALAAFNEAQPETISRVRVDVGWSASQPTTAAPTIDQWYNKRLMALFAAMEARNLTPYVVVHQSPPWARTAASDGGGTVSNTETKRFPDDPVSIEVWAQWFAATYALHVTEIEFWNEPNLSAFTGWNAKGVSAATPARYVPLLKAFTTGARRGNPAVKIIAPNVSQCDWKWIQDCYALGMGPYVDIIGVHPYQGRQSIPPASIDPTGIDKSQPGWEKYRIALGLPKIYATMVAHGDGHKPIWNTEAGWAADTTSAGVGPAGVPGTWATLEDKAAFFHRQWLDMCVSGKDAGGAQAAYKKVTLSTVYQLFDPVSTDAHQKGFEIIEAGGAFKPQALALIAWRAANPVTRPLH